MQKKYTKQLQKKEPFPTKLNHLSYRPSAHQLVAFFGAAGNAEAQAAVNSR